MAIATTDEIKALLNITNTDYDTLIAALIPVLTGIILAYTNNYFHTNTFISGTTIAFVDSDPDTITDSDSGFVDAGFTDDIDIHVEDSADYSVFDTDFNLAGSNEATDNAGYYHVDTVVAGTLTLASGESLIAESAGAGIIITRMRFPKGLQLPLAQMVQLCISKSGAFKGISSESLNEHAISYFGGKDGGGDWPDSILNVLKKYRKLQDPV